MNALRFRRRSLVHMACCAIGIGLMYWLLWNPGLPTVTKLFQFEKAHRNSSCLLELLATFGITALNLSAQTYVRLSKPVPIGPACRDQLAGFESSSGPTIPSNVIKQKEVLTAAEQEMTHRHVQQLFTNFSQLNLELFLAEGSLLGSVRHFGFIPWDWDIDLMIPSRQKQIVKSLLVNLSASDDVQFVDTESTNQHFKLEVFCSVSHSEISNNNSSDSNSSSSRRTKKKLHRTKQCKAQVDFFFGWTDKQTPQLYRRLEPPGVFLMDNVYPLTLRPFGPYLLPAPRHPEAFLAAVYGADYESKCQVGKLGSIVCRQLRSVYPLVARLSLPYLDKLLRVELLVQNSSMLSLFIPKP